MNSARAEAEFKDKSKLERLAISIGRRALDPLAEITGIWQSSELLNIVDWNAINDTNNNNSNSSYGANGPSTSGGFLVSGGLLGRNGERVAKSSAVTAATNPLKNDILAMNLHPLQSSVSPALLLRALPSSP